MDYVFFTHKIGNLPSEVLAVGKKLAEKYYRGFDTPNFRPREGFHSIHSTVAPEEVTNYVKLCASLINDFFPMSALIQFDFNTLEPGVKIGEHTDMQGPLFNGWVVNHCHKVQIAINVENSIGTHRRSYQNPPEMTKFEEGGIYVYNNYVPHEVQNLAASNRTHITLMYDDRDWSIKKKLYEKLGVVNPAF